MYEGTLRSLCNKTSQYMLCFDMQTDYYFVSTPLKGVNASKIEELIENITSGNNNTSVLNELGLNIVDQWHLEHWVGIQLAPTHESNSQDWQSYVNTMRTLHKVILKLSKVTDLDELYRQAILNAQQYLYLDRSGILLLDKFKNEMYGTWGTNENGEVVCESDFRSPLPDAPWAVETIASKDYVAVWDNKELLYYNKTVGHGWNAMAAMWDGDEAIGWIACDNLIHHRPLQPWLKEIIGHYGQSLGHLIVRLKKANELKNANINLEKTVERRSRELIEKIELLEQTQDELIESEKLASLGSLVAGVAHEVNTPLGIGITAATDIASHTDKIIQRFNDKSISQTALQTYLNDVQEGSDILTKNLIKAGDLIASFKKLSSDQSQDLKERFNLHSDVENLFKSFGHEVKNKPISLINAVSSDININSYPSRINQILTNLIHNSLVHGFEHIKEGEIQISAQVHTETLTLNYFDTGKGVNLDQLDKVFDPFYTTKRNQGGTGLGLNIVHNLVKKMHGNILVTPHTPHGLHFSITLPT